MVEICRFPARQRMAFIAITGNSRDMIGWHFVAGLTTGVYTCVFVAGMTSVTIQCSMNAGEFEIGMRLMAVITLIYGHDTRLI